MSKNLNLSVVLDPKLQFGVEKSKMTPDNYVPLNPLISSLCGVLQGGVCIHGGGELLCLLSKIDGL